MGIGKHKKEQQLSEASNRKHKQKLSGSKKYDINAINIDSKSTKFKRIKKKNEEKKKKQSKDHNEEVKKKVKKGVKEESDTSQVQQPTASPQLSYFLHQYQSANGIQLSPLELESFKGVAWAFSFHLSL